MTLKILYKSLKHLFVQTMNLLEHPTLRVGKHNIFHLSTTKVSFILHISLTEKVNDAIKKKQINYHLSSWIFKRITSCTLKARHLFNSKKKKTGNFFFHTDWFNFFPFWEIHFKTSSQLCWGHFSAEQLYISEFRNVDISDNLIVKMLLFIYFLFFLFCSNFIFRQGVGEIIFLFVFYWTIGISGINKF